MTTTTASASADERARDGIVRNDRARQALRHWVTRRIQPAIGQRLVEQEMRARRAVSYGQGDRIWFTVDVAGGGRSGWRRGVVDTRNKMSGRYHVFDIDRPLKTAWVSWLHIVPRFAGDMAPQTPSAHTAGLTTAGMTPADMTSDGGLVA